MVVPFAAGGATDVVARLVAEKLGEQTRATFVVENKAGAAGAIGAKAVIAARQTDTRSCSERRGRKP